MTESPTAKYTKFWFCVTFSALFRSDNDNFSAYIIEPISNTERHIFYEKTNIFNDTTYVLFFNTFVTFGVPYIYLPYFSAVLYRNGKNRSADHPHPRITTLAH